MKDKEDKWIKILDKSISSDPKQEFIYVYHLPIETFKQTQIDKHQFVSLVAVKPIKTEKLKVKDYTHLIRKATKKETDYWIKKYCK